MGGMISTGLDPPGRRAKTSLGHFQARSCPTNPPCDPIYADQRRRNGWESRQGTQWGGTTSRPGKKCNWKHGLYPGAGAHGWKSESSSPAPALTGRHTLGHDFPSL